MSEFYRELGLDRQTVLGKIQHQVSPDRYQHMLRVEKAAIDLAKIFGEDPSRAGLAGLLHDYAKAYPDQEFLRLIETYRLDPGLKDWGNNIWHGMVGIYKIQEDLNLKDSEILRAIEIHTVGAAHMTLLDKIVYVADYVEEGREFPGVSQARNLARQSLDAAVAFETARTIEYLVRKRLPVYPQTIETYNAFVKFLDLSLV